MNNELYREAAQLAINAIDRELRMMAKPLAEPEQMLDHIEEVHQITRNCRHLLYNTVFEVDDADEDLKRLIRYLKQLQKDDGCVGSEA